MLVGRSLFKTSNGLRFSRAAPIDRVEVRAHPEVKKATILSPPSGVGCKRMLARPVGVALSTCSHVWYVSAIGHFTTDLAVE
jgi:hypothetical protein